MNPEVDLYVSRLKKWPKEVEKLRKIILGCGLSEELKWTAPCYAFDGKNMVVIQAFKEYCGLLFFKGCLLSDTDGILVKTGKNTRVSRQIRFNSVREIVKLESVFKAHIYEAVEVERAGVKVDIEKLDEPEIPAEFRKKLDEHPALKRAFHALTPGRQRAYIFYFGQPKLAKTREGRVRKYIKQILNRKGLN